MTDIHIEHKIKSDLLDIRLDKFLRTIGVKLSRSRINLLIKNGKILVNNKIPKPSYKVKCGDTIIVDYERLTSNDIKAEDIPLNIIYEDDDIIVINKQENIVVHPARGNREGTMVNALLHHTKISGGDKSRPGVIHRLDKNTTGVMVFAKNDESLTTLSKQIEKRTMKRTYLALVWGSIMRKYIKIDEPIGRKISDKRLMAVTSVNSRNAVTEIRRIASFDIASMIKVKLQTGRTHQIRVHMAFMGHPVIGDDYYGKFSRSAVKDLDIDIKKHFDNINNFMKRQALHSVSLGFKHPKTFEDMMFYAPLPKDMIDLLNRLRNLDNGV